MSIYIATDEAGKGIRHITEFDSRLDLLMYANSEISCTDIFISQKATIPDILESLYDHGIGFGQRSHRRISRQDAIKMLKDQPWIKNNTFLGDE